MKANETKLSNLPNLFKHSLSWSWPNFIVVNKKGNGKHVKKSVQNSFFLFCFSHFEDRHVVKSSDFIKTCNTQSQIETDIFTGRNR